MYADISMDDKFQIESGYDPHDKVPWGKEVHRSFSLGHVWLVVCMCIYFRSNSECIYSKWASAKWAV